jgi:RNA polymerase sigma-70 factor, ECF subfamily
LQPAASPAVTSSMAVSGRAPNFMTRMVSAAVLSRPARSLLARVTGAERLQRDSASAPSRLSGNRDPAAVYAARKPGAPDPSIPWLIGVARHKLADHWRQVGREQRGLRLLDGEPARVEDPWQTVVDRIRAREVLDGLGAHHRAALTLRYLDGLPVPEVAQHLDRTLHATEALLVRARAAFRRIYEAEEGSR